MPAMQHGSPADIRYQVETRGAQLFYCQSGGEIFGCFVLRIDHAPSGSEGVVVAAGGSLTGFDITLNLLPHVERMFKGVHRIRIHTARPGMAKKLAALGYWPREFVFGKDVGQ